MLAGNSYKFYDNTAILELFFILDLSIETIYSACYTKEAFQPEWKLTLKSS